MEAQDYYTKLERENLLPKEKNKLHWDKEEVILFAELYSRIRLTEKIREDNLDLLKDTSDLKEILDSDIAKLKNDLIDHLIISNTGWNDATKEIYLNSREVIKTYYEYLILKKTVDNSDKKILEVQKKLRQRI